MAKKVQKFIPIVPYIEGCFICEQVDGGYDLMRLQPHQKRILEAAFTPDVDGRLPYRTVIYSCPKKSGKSSLEAAVASWFGFSGISPPGGEIYIIANDKSQAEQRVFSMIRQSVEKSPILLSQCKDGQVLLQGIETLDGIKIRPIACDYAGEAGANPVLTCWDELWANTCFPLENQAVRVLTIAGWRDARDVTLNDELATLDDSGKIEYQFPTSINLQQYRGPVVKLKHRRATFAVTPNHRIYCATAYNGRSRSAVASGHTPMEWGLIPASEAMCKAFGWIKADAAWDAPDIKTVRIGDVEIDGDGFMALLGWYISEGSCCGSRGRVGCVVISQSRSANSEKYDEIVRLVRSLGFNPRLHKSDVSFSSSSLAKFFSLLGHSSQKHIPSRFKNASARQLRIFLDAYLKGDGWKTGSRGWQAYTSSRRLADDLLEVGLKAGFMPRLMSKRNGPGRKGGLIEGRRIVSKEWNYRVSFSTSPIEWEGRLGQWGVENYAGAIWCPTVPNGIFYVNVDGYCFWTGNSQSGLRLWEEFTPVPTRRISTRLVVTYAGYEGKGVLWNLYEAGVKGRRLWDDLPVWVNDEQKLLCYWDTGEVARRMPWQTGEVADQYYREQKAMLSRSNWLRLHENMWAAGEEGLNLVDWDACVALSDERHLNYTIPVENRRTTLAVGIDAAYKFDRASVMTVFKRKGMFYRGPGIWWPTGNGFTLDVIADYLIELRRHFKIGPVYFDPYQMVHLAGQLRKRGFRMVEFPQSTNNHHIQGNMLIQALQYRRLVLPPIDGEGGSSGLRQQAAAASVVTTPKGVKLEKSEKNSKIDSIVALAMALVAADTLPDYDDIKDQIMVLDPFDIRRTGA